MEKTKFIRKNGKIIPIRSKGNKQEQKRSTYNKVDFATGAVSSALSVMLFKRKGFGTALGLGSFASGVGTSAGRASNEKSASSFVARDLGGMVLKGAGAITGGLIGMGALKGLNSLSKLHKASKVKKVFKALR